MQVYTCEYKKSFNKTMSKPEIIMNLANENSENEQEEPNVPNRLLSKCECAIGIYRNGAESEDIQKAELSGAISNKAEIKTDAEKISNVQINTDTESDIEFYKELQIGGKSSYAHVKKKYRKFLRVKRPAYSVANTSVAHPNSEISIEKENEDSEESSEEESYEGEGSEEERSEEERSEEERSEEERSEEERSEEERFEEERSEEERFEEDSNEENEGNISKNDSDNELVIIVPSEENEQSNNSKDIPAVQIQISDTIDVPNEDGNETHQEEIDEIDRLCYEREYNNYSTQYVIDNDLDEPENPSDSDNEIHNGNIEFIDSPRVHSLYNNNQTSLKSFTISNILYKDCLKGNAVDMPSISVNSGASGSNSNAIETIQKYSVQEDELHYSMQNEKNKDVTCIDRSHLSQDTTATYSASHTDCENNNILNENTKSLINVEEIDLSSATVSESQEDIARSQVNVTEDNTSFNINNTHSKYENLYNNNTEHLNRRKSRDSITSKIYKRKKYLTSKYFSSVRTPNAISNNALNNVFEECNNQAADENNARCIPAILPYNGDNVINAIANGFNYTVQTNSDRHAELCRQSQIKENPNSYTNEEYRNFQGVEQPTYSAVVDQHESEQNFRSNQVTSRNTDDTWQYRFRLNESNEYGVKYNSLQYQNFGPPPLYIYPYAHKNSFKQIPLNLSIKDANQNAIDYSRKSNDFNINLNNSRASLQNLYGYNYTYAHDLNQAAPNQNQDILFNNMAIPASNFHQNEFPQAGVQDGNIHNQEIFSRVDAEHARYKLQRDNEKQISNNSPSIYHEQRTMPIRQTYISHDIRHSDSNTDNRLDNMQNISSRQWYSRLIDNQHHSVVPASVQQLTSQAMNNPSTNMRNVRTYLTAFDDQSIVQSISQPAKYYAINNKHYVKRLPIYPNNENSNI